MNTLKHPTDLRHKLEELLTIEASFSIAHFPTSESQEDKAFPDLYLFYDGYLYRYYNSDMGKMGGSQAGKFRMKLPSYHIVNLDVCEKTRKELTKWVCNLLD